MSESGQKKTVAAAGPPASPRPPVVEKKPKRKRWIFAGLVLLLLAGIWLAPAFVARTSLLDRLLCQAIGIDGSISRGPTSLGWFSGVGVEQLEIRDPSGELLASIASIQGDTSLLGLALRQSSVGRFEVDGAVVNLVLRDKGSNFEDVFAPLLSRPHGNVAAELEVKGARVTIDDLPTQSRYQLQDLNVSLNTRDAADQLKLQASGKLATTAAPAGFELSLAGSTGTPNQAPFGSGQVSCDLNGLPLDLVSPAVRRVLPGAKLTGALTAKFTGAWGGEQPAHLEGDARVDDFSLAAAALGADRLALSKIHFPCKLSQSGDTVRLEKLTVDCDLARVDVSGSVQVGQFDMAHLLASLASEELTIEGHVDLARLASLLPQTLHVRPGTQITEGEARLVVSGRGKGDEVAWQGRLDTTRIAAQSERGPIAWEQPITIDLAGRQTKTGPIVDRANCTSSFLEVKAAGTPEQLEGSLRFDLGRLTAELRQFLDLTFNLAGTGTGNLHWRRSTDGQLAAAVEFQAQQFQFITAGRRPWSEPAIAAQLKGAGQYASGSPTRLDSFSAGLQTAGDRLDVSLLQPVSEPGTSGWPLQLTWQGELADWLPRIESFADLTGWDVSGKAALGAKLAWSASGIRIEQSKLTAERLHAWGPALYLDEPAVSLEGAGSWQSSESRCEVPSAVCQAGETTLRISNASLTLPKQGAPLASGSCSYKTDAGQLARWLQSPKSAAWRASGQGSGELQLTEQDGITSIRFDGAFANLQIAEAAAPAAGGAAAAAVGWSEPKLDMQARLSYRRASDLLKIDQLSLASAALKCAVQGQIAAASVTADADLQGKLDYDLEKLGPLWRPYLGPGAKLAGQESRAFALRGPLAARPGSSRWQQLAGEADLAWEGAEVYALPIGKGQLAGKLAGGIVDFIPLDVQVSEGRFKLAPQIRLSPEPAELRLAKGPMVEQVRITPEICAKALKFIAPILAEVTRTEGRFSVDLAGGIVPLAAPAKADISGQLLIHSVAVKPGPIADEFLGLGRQIENLVLRREPSPNDGALLTIENQNVDFRMVEGRVYHQGLKFMAGIVPVTTRGSVGLDESLALVAEVTLGSWIPDGSPFAGLKGQTLEVHVGGTLRRPLTDGKALERLGAQLIGKAVPGLLLDRLNKRLDKLLPTGK